MIAGLLDCWVAGLIDCVASFSRRQKTNKEWVSFGLLDRGLNRLQVSGFIVGGVGGYRVSRVSRVLVGCLVLKSQRRESESSMFPTCKCVVYCMLVGVGVYVCIYNEVMGLVVPAAVDILMLFSLSLSCLSACLHTYHLP